MGCQQTSGCGRWQLTTALVCLLGLGNIVTSQVLSVWDPVKTTCNMDLGRGVVVGNKMYIDGGEIVDQQYYKNGIDKPYPRGNLIHWQNIHLWELDLSQNFNVSRPPWTVHTKPEDSSEHYNGASGTLWNVGDGRFYTLGGKFSNRVGPTGNQILEPYYTQNASGYYFQLPDPRVFAYDPQTGNWSSELLPKGVRRIYDAAYTQSARNLVGYTFGGTLVNEKQFSATSFTADTSDGDWLDLMSAYDFKTGKFNSTTMPSSIGKTKLAMVHSLDRVGYEGVLVAFAGISNNNNIQQARPMDEIFIYDIATSTWMQQKATGSIPSPRFRTCSVLVPAPDLSSFQVYLFSGVTEGYGRVLEMHVLSIPTFTWTKIEMKNYPNEWPIADMACGLYEERQFIIVPGEPNVTTAATATDSFWSECNNGTAVHVFDTYDWEFKPEFDPDNKGPKVPPTIFNLVGGSGTGGATLQQPKSGWGDNDLGTIFSIRNQLPPETEPEFPHTTSPKTSSPQASSRSETKPNKNAIIGGVVGGVCAAALAAGILIFFVKRYRKPSQLDKAEIGGECLRSELYGQNYNSHGSHELHAYEPQELSGEAVGSCTLVNGMNEAALFKHSTTTTAAAASTCSTP